MKPGDLEAFLYENIPLTKSMGVSALRADVDEVSLTAPLESNVNHHGTAFGGSITALALSAGWALVRLNIGNPKIVIHKAEFAFHQPIRSALTATAKSKGIDWESFERKLAAKGIARVKIVVHLTESDVECCTAELQYVAFVS